MYANTRNRGAFRARGTWHMYIRASRVAALFMQIELPLKHGVQKRNIKIPEEKWSGLLFAASRKISLQMWISSKNHTYYARPPFFKHKNNK